MAIVNNLSTVGTDGTEVVGDIIVDILGVYYILTGNGLYQIPEAIAQAIDARTSSLRSPVTISSNNVASDLLIITSFTTNDPPFDVYQQDKVLTTDDTATNLHSVPIPTGKALCYSGYVVAHRTGGVSGSADDSAAYRVEFVARNISGTVTVIGATVTVLGEDQIAWDVTVNDSSPNVHIDVTGAINNNITWTNTGHWMTAGA